MLHELLLGLQLDIYKRRPRSLRLAIRSKQLFKVRLPPQHAQSALVQSDYVAENARASGLEAAAGFRRGRVVRSPARSLPPQVRLK